MKTNINYYVFALILFMSCNSNRESSTEDDSLTDTSGDSVVLNISYQIPGDLPSDASEEELARFAWNEFFALNWASSWPDDQKRATPNTNWKFAGSGPAPNVAVWETYIHRTELRPANGKRTRTLTSGKPYYTFINPVDTTTNNVTLSNYWVNLDEDNEIGSAYVFAYDSTEVLYMAKSNLVEYTYVRDNFPTDSLLKIAVDNGTDPSLNYLKKVTQEGATCNSDTASHVICLPCGSNTEEGTIEIKTAWRFLLDGKDDPSRFITKPVVYYTEENGLPTAHSGTMGLIGMHIIRKTQNYPAFIFASWEQLDVRKADMQTIGLDTPVVNNMPDPNVDPHQLEPVVPRNIPAAIQSVNTEAHNLITSQNPASLWQYYQLIGVQGTPIDYADRGQDDNYFMANYVIESDSLLTVFHGSFADPFNTSLQNVVYKGESYNMGGCQGCHGQAQIGGTDFSFLLDFGAGKPVPEPDLLLTVDEALEKANPSQIKNYVEKFEQIITSKQ
ncbi:hypothetical protein LVD17_23160 [Fulvivirga ulvae]|uniref:hypothetical protein n=1 Tax=Fulvivirga ulvae TaxID=2904245 RepID=UPI001F17ADA9|nr:hypothetical protein [Fulvivirga ulvae]UII31195.1 hypothetical protein LVD17_23160 [Fulvivirga ulvae]